MRINFNTNLKYNFARPGFNGRLDKVIENIKTAIDFKRTKVSVDDALSIYKKYGYSIRVKTGSHISITSGNGFEFSLILPHKNGKRFIGPYDVKKLKFVVNNDIQGLINSIKI